MEKMKVYILDCGRMELDKNFLVACSTYGVVGNEHPGATWVWTPMWCVLIDHPEKGYVLYDTGVNPDLMKGRASGTLADWSPYYASEEQLMPNRLKQLGIDPLDIKHVIISHMHVDHDGCLEYCKNAVVHVMREEVQKAGEVLLTGKGKDNGAYEWFDLNAIAQAGLEWDIIDAEPGEIVPFAEGIDLVAFGSGHAYGMLGLVLKLTNSGNKLLVSDCCYNSENDGPPTKAPGIIHDSLGWAKTVARYHKIARQYDAEIWYGHDQKQWATIKKSTEGYYD